MVFAFRDYISNVSHFKLPLVLNSSTYSFVPVYESWGKVVALSMVENILNEFWKDGLELLESGCLSHDALCDRDDRLHVQSRLWQKLELCKWFVDCGGRLSISIQGKFDPTFLTAFVAARVRLNAQFMMLYLDL